MLTSTEPDIGTLSQGGNIDASLRNNSDLIHWDHNDSENPFNFPKWKKVMICGLVCMHTSLVTMCSSTAAPFAQDLQEEFNITPIVSRLPVAMYLFGLALGPVLLTPLAEDFGRKTVLTICLGILYTLQIPCALSPSFAPIVVCRLICGITGSTVLNSVGNIPDLWKGDDVIGLWAMNFWAYSAEAVVLGPLVGTYINQALGWRWVFGIWGIVGASLMIPFVFLVPETRAGVILTARAQRARGSGRPRAWTIYEKEGHRSFRQILTETVLRPAVMLLTEPIVYCFALYDGLNYAIIYLAVEAIPLIYAKFGIIEPKVEITFVAMQIGFTVAIPFFYLQLKATKWQETRLGKTDVPENKLLWAFLAAILFPISMYWFAWTSVPSISIYSSLGALVFFGISGHIGTFAFVAFMQLHMLKSTSVFLAVSDYTVESYGPMASSAVTGQSFARENICGILSLVSVYFYENVGFQWASTILAILATLMGIFPFLFYRYGPVIRRKSRYAQELARLEKEERQRLKALEIEFNRTLE